MANVIQLGSSDLSERAQLIIITGLLIAVALIALTLLLNTAIYTQNLASRGSDVGGETAIEFRQSSVEFGEELLITENNKEYESKDNLVENISDGIESFATSSTRRYAEVGTAIRISNISFNNGTRVRQTDTARNFTNASFNPDWELTSDAENIREFSLKIQTVQSVSESDAFNVTIVGQSSQWSLLIHDDGGPEDATIKVVNDSLGSPEEICDSGITTPFTINITAATVNGEPCSDLAFTDSVNPPYSVKFTNGGNSRGTYNLSINGSISDPTNDFNSLGGGSPYEFDIVYSTHFDVSFQTEEVTYRTRVRLAPGEQS